jgi:hypothetical protein
MVCCVLQPKRLISAKNSRFEVHEITSKAAGFLSRPAAFFFPFFHLRPVIDSSTMVFFTQDSGL